MFCWNIFTLVVLLCITVRSARAVEVNHERGWHVGSHGTRSNRYENITFLDWVFPVHKWDKVKKSVLCSGKRGSWVYHPVPTIVNSNNCLRSGGAPYHDGNCKNAIYSKGVFYEWTLDEADCGFKNEQYSSKKLCSIINGRNVLIVGDSISEEFAEVFAEAFDDIGGQCKADVLFTEIPIPCQNAPQFVVTYIRNDVLSLVTVDNYNNKTHKLREDNYGRCFDTEGKECEWVNHINRLNASILILNRGAHFVPTPNVLSELNTTLSYLALNHPSLSIIYRNTPVGHDPYQEAFLDAPFLVAPTPPKLYNYDEFYQQNVDVYHLLRNLFPHVLYVDFYTSTALRVDSHRDPLHYCIPGPPASWMQTLMYNAFRIVRDYAYGVLH